MKIDRYFHELALIKAIIKCASEDNIKDSLLKKIIDSNPKPGDLESHVIAILSQDHCGILNYANKAAEKLFMYPEGMLVGYPSSSLVPDDERLTIKRRRAFDDIIEGRKQFIYEPRTNRIQLTGKVIEIQAYLIPYNLRGRNAIAAVVSPVKTA